jgi:hypothetical protein
MRKIILKVEDIAEIENGFNHGFIEPKDLKLLIDDWKNFNYNVEEVMDIAIYWHETAKEYKKLKEE